MTNNHIKATLHECESVYRQRKTDYAVWVQNLNKRKGDFLETLKYMEQMGYAKGDPDGFQTDVTYYGYDGDGNFLWDHKNDRHNCILKNGIKFSVYYGSIEEENNREVNLSLNDGFVEIENEGKIPFHRIEIFFHDYLFND
jgi:hypothetical protein